MRNRERLVENRAQKRGKRLSENRAKKLGKALQKMERKRIEKRMETAVSERYRTGCEGLLDEPGSSAWTVAGQSGECQMKGYQVIV